MDECLEKIAAASKPKALDAWITKFAGLKQLKHRVAQRLVDRDVLREDEGRVLLVFSRKIYPESDPRPERELTERLRRAMFGYDTEVDPRTVVLLSLANSAGLLRQAFDRKELKRCKARIEQVVNGEATGQAAKQAIEAMQAAVVVTAIIPAVITT